MMQKILQKKANRNIIIFICMVLIALLCRILGKISFQYVLNGIVRSIIYIGLYIGWAISIHKRVVQKSVKNTLLLISGLMIFWFIIRTIKYFFTIDANIERYLWYSYYLPMLFIPQAALQAAILLGQPEEYTLPCHYQSSGQSKGSKGVFRVSSSEFRTRAWDFDES